MDTLEKFAGDDSGKRSHILRAYGYFREDAITAARAVDPSLTDSEAVAAVTIALRYYTSVGDLFSYADFGTLSNALAEESK